MAFWLAKTRKGQVSNYLQRFDPRFWTVDFPRPAMACVETTAPDALRLTVEMHHKGELVGLIWDSVDRYDHPLLAYETNRDYSHTILSFRWQSNGAVALDDVNGPTLSIEGKDAAGQARTWYVRLWNYAVGTGSDAEITLSFSDLQSGFTLPGEPIYPADIDRMFLSIVPSGFVAGSSDPLALPFIADITLSNIDCDGTHSMLEIGDVYLPAHGERIATAYDDAYNQTPARLVRNISGLGYREDIIHYVGMSHFMRVAPTGSGQIETVRSGELCAPASRWHRNFFELCARSDLEVIASISYELFDEYCPYDWKQRTSSGEAAQTGWVPPSTLLSPASLGAMSWLQASATAFAALLEEAGQPVRVQIGEPWWWVTQAGEICLYDDSAKAAFGGSPVEIDDLRSTLDASQISLLDEAGALLAQSTLDLAQAVRDFSTGPAEILLLAFTPSVLDPAMPEQYRANLPAGWAAPAFDRLQIEDYDWLTGGADALRRSAYAFVNSRLNYPLEKQDYLAGFVLNAVSADDSWPLIDAGLDEAAKRSITRRYVWALPQVMRDGYTRLISYEPEDAVQAFDDVLYPFPLGKNTAVAPEFSTSISVTASGFEQRNSLWSDARMHFDVGPGIRSESELSELIRFFRARRGAAKGFRVHDPFDHSSNGMTGEPTATDQLIGLGDGLKADFQLSKAYGDTSEPQIRTVTRPVEASVLLSIDGTPTTDFELLDKGAVRLEVAPPPGAEIRAGFKFDVPVRFAEDRIDISAVNFAAGEAPSIPLVEIRETE